MSPDERARSMPQTLARLVQFYADSGQPGFIFGYEDTFAVMDVGFVAGTVDGDGGENEGRQHQCDDDGFTNWANPFFPQRLTKSGQC